MTSKLAGALRNNRANMRITDDKDRCNIDLYHHSKLKKVYPYLKYVLTGDYEDKITVISKDDTYDSWPDFENIRMMIIGDIKPVSIYHDSTIGALIQEYRVCDIIDKAEFVKIDKNYLYIASKK